MLVKDLIGIIENWNVYARYGMCNILWKKFGNKLYKTDFMETAKIEKSDIYEVIDYYLNKTHYSEIAPQEEGKIKYKLDKENDENKKNKAGHLIVSDGWGDLLNNIKKCKSDENLNLIKALAPYSTANQNPRCQAYQKYDIYFIGANIISTITSDKFSCKTVGYFPAFKKIESYFRFFNGVMENRELDTIRLVHTITKDSETPYRPKDYHMNFDGFFKSIIIKKHGDPIELNELKFFNIKIETLKQVEKLGDEYKNFIADSNVCDWYSYSQEEIILFSSDLKTNDFLYRYYNDFAAIFKDIIYSYKEKTEKIDNTRSFIYELLMKYFKFGDIEFIEKIINIGTLNIKRENILIEECINSLSLTKIMKTITTELGQSLKKSFFKLATESATIIKNENDKKEYVKQKILYFRKKIFLDLKNSDTISEFFACLAEFCNTHKISIPNFDIEELINMSEKEFKEFKIALSIELSMYNPKKLKQEESVLEPLEEIKFQTI